MMNKDWFMGKVKNEDGSTISAVGGQVDPPVMRRVDGKELQMNFDNAVKRACEEPTLNDALTLICVWEFERARKLVKPNEPYETCFKHCIREVYKKYDSESVISTAIGTAIGILNMTDDNHVKDMAANIADSLISITDVPDA